MKLVFLCGGVGRRMWPLVEDKFLLKFIGRTLLEHQIDTARKAGLFCFVFIGSPDNIGRIESIVGKIPGIHFQVTVQKEARGIADAIESAAALLDGEAIIQCSNDIVEPEAYRSLMQAKEHCPAQSYLLACRVKDYFPGGYLVTDDDNNLLRIIEKPGAGNRPGDLVNILVHLHARPEKIPGYASSIVTSKDDAYELALGAMAAAGEKVRVVPYSGAWLSIKYPWHILRVAHHFLDAAETHISPSAHISRTAVIEGKVIIGDNVRIMENAVIKGPVYIGQNSIIGNGALVRDYAHIGDNCLIGYSTEIKNSYINDGCRFHMSYVGDSIIGEGCSFGAGTVLGNLRFDEKNIRIKMGEEIIDTGLRRFGAVFGRHCRTGIHAGVMPGVRVGEGAVIGPHVCLDADLLAGSKAIASPGYRVIAGHQKPVGNGVKHLGSIAA